LYFGRTAKGDEWKLLDIVFLGFERIGVVGLFPLISLALVSELLAANSVIMSSRELSESSSSEFGISLGSGREGVGGTLSLNGENGGFDRDRFV
jgi:hypothetical protein